jgi:hypothetical protein
MGIDFSGALVLTAVVKEAGGPAGMVAFIFIFIPKRPLCSEVYILNI